MSNNSNHEDAVAPQNTIKRRLNLFGRPGLLTAAVQVNFAYLGRNRSEVKDVFYTRHARLPVAVTVNGCIEIVRCNVLPISDDFILAQPNEKNATQPGSLPDGYCMLSIDLRNVWPQPLSIRLVSKGGEDGAHEKDEFAFDDIVQPGHVSRSILLIPRVFIQKRIRYDTESCHSTTIRGKRV